MKTMLLTGGAGFLGKYLAQTAKKEFDLKILGRAKTADFIVDLSVETPVLGAGFDWVIHNAGKAHIVPKTPAEEQAFYQVNQGGTVRLLAALDQCECKPSHFIFISTIAVYGLEEGKNIHESSPLNGSSPYAKSKIAAEKAIREWCGLNGVNCIILRLPLVVGENAPGNLGAIKKAIEKGYYFRIKQNMARKSVVLAADVAMLLPKLEGKNGTFNLTDGHDPSFSSIEDSLAKSAGRPIRFTLPMGLIKIAAKLGDLLSLLHLPTPLNTAKLNKMTATLTFDSCAAVQGLGWQPRPAFPS